MKNILLSVVLAAFALAAQAGENKPAASQKTDAPCCASAKATTASPAECPMAKEGKGCCAAMAKGASKATHKQALLSPKARSNAG
jgi:hypothetical protein